MDHPKLIEHGARNYIHNALEMCHSNRVKVYSMSLNIGVLIFFTAIVALSLYFSYKRKPTEAEMRHKMIKDQEMVLSKIRYYQAEQKNLMSSPIGLATTNLRDLVDSS